MRSGLVCREENLEFNVLCEVEPSTVINLAILFDVIVCTQIANCLEGYCSNVYNQKCDRCDGDFGPSDGSAYAKSGDQRQCIRK